MKKIAIIGAGLSGLSIAHLLKNRANITLFEKSRGVSGRMSTRRSEPYFFDHGAQYFTARTAPFQAFIRPLLDQGIIEQWDSRYVKFRGSQMTTTNNCANKEARYVGVPGMSQVGKFLAKDLDVRLNTRIVLLEKKGKWQLTDDSGNQYVDFDWVICSAPSPQATELLPKYFSHYQIIQDISMKACFSLMLGFENTLPLEFDSAHVTESDVSWIAVNSQKPKRVGRFTLVIHSSETYAENHIEENHTMVMAHLMKETSRIIGYDVSDANYKTLHGWRYANNTDKNQEHVLCLDCKHQLAVCGDWLVGGRVEGAFTSAYHLAQKMEGFL